MERQVDLNAISDGRLYGLEDMVRADCAGCAGCSACCMGMGKSVVLDPYDVYRLVNGTGMSFETLLQKHLELNVVDGVILPNLKMAGAQEACAFLNEEGRCSVHPYRPGICRIFPLGRLYENGSFQYILQVNECKKGNRSKVKVKKWIDTPNAKQYDQYISNWHYFLKDLEKLVKADAEGKTAKAISMYVLKIFYLTGFSAEQDFFEQFYSRLETAGKFFRLQ
ncbi:MAG: YkgJ family cysteine cluster protein [Lachnoclostridium sp.]|nr:YkgJ family cysteine cluster protein [Lachnoclostridium sp.]